MIVDYTPAVVKSVQRGPILAQAFVQGEWKAFRNGILCALLGGPYADQRQTREQWPYAHRWAWDLGYNGMEKLLTQPDVQRALAFRFGGMEV